MAIYDVYGYLSDVSSAGVFTMTENQESAVFTIQYYYDPVYDDFFPTTPETISTTITKLDGDELDFTIYYPTGDEIIRTKESTIPLPPMNPGDNSNRKQLVEMLNELKRIRK